MSSLMVDQESKKAPLEGEHMKKEVQYCGLKKEIWPSDWSFLRIVWSTYQNLGIS